MRKNNKVRDIDEYKREKKNRNRNRRLKKSVKKKSKIFLALLTLGFVIFNMSIYSVSTHLKYEVNTLKKEKKQKQRERDDLKVELDVMSKSGYIEKEATERLNMVYPEGHQIKFIDISK